MTQQVNISEIVLDAGTQVRAGLNEATVGDYAEALAEGATFPPVVVFHDGKRYVAADGFHRIQGAIRIGRTEIECDIRSGSKVEALKFALGCNAHHGLRRTNADKRHAVAIALREFPQLSDRALAEMCLVGNDLVGEMRRAQLSVSDSCAVQTRVGLDGKVRRLPTAPMARREAERHLTPSLSPTEAERESCAADATIGGVLLAGQVLDSTGWPVPANLIPLCQRGGEVQEMLTNLSRVRGALRTAQDNGDILYAEMNLSSALLNLDQLWYEIKAAKPFAVCPSCQGQAPESCTLCRGRGLISEHRWNTGVPREDKELRFKVRTAPATKGTK
jgi:hypothetical protein